MTNDRKWIVDPATGATTDPNHPWHPDYAGPPIETGEQYRQRILDEGLPGLHGLYVEGQVLAALEAAIHFEKADRAWPGWVRRAMIRIALLAVSDRMPKRRGPYGSSPAARYRGDLIHYARWECVTEAREHGDNPEQSFRSAAKMLGGNVEPGAVKQSFEKVEGWKGRFAYLRDCVHLLRLEDTQQRSDEDADPE